MKILITTDDGTVVDALKVSLEFEDDERERVAFAREVARLIELTWNAEEVDIP